MARGAGGATVAAIPTATGIVTRVENIDGQTVLTFGNGKALITNITGVTAAPAETAATDTTTPTPTPPATAT